jgi:hypothetical protein
MLAQHANEVIFQKFSIQFNNYFINKYMLTAKI